MKAPVKKDKKKIPIAVVIILVILITIICCTIVYAIVYNLRQIVDERTYPKISGYKSLSIDYGNSSRHEDIVIHSYSDYSNEFAKINFDKSLGGKFPADLFSDSDFIAKDYLVHFFNDSKCSQRVFYPTSVKVSGDEVILTEFVSDEGFGVCANKFGALFIPVEKNYIGSNFFVTVKTVYKRI